MTSFRARVRNGRLILDEPTELPDGTEVELVPTDAWDDLDEGERSLLHESLAKSDEDVALGRIRSAADVLADLRRPAR